MIPAAKDNRALPAAHDAEQQVIGALLLQPELIRGVAKTLRPSDFIDPQHRATLAVLFEMDRNGVPVDVATVKQKLDSLPEFNGESSAAYLSGDPDVINRRGRRFKAE